MAETKIKKVGVLTGGGDCPGLNAAIRAIVIRGEQLGLSIVGIKEGWKGMLEGRAESLDETKVSEILAQGGTILESSRTNPLKEKDGLKKVMQNFKKLKLSALIPIGGDDTLGVAQKLPELPMVAVPKTIDNDLQGTDFCIGFWTAVQIASEAIEKLRTTARSHQRIMILEVMGRDFGWIASYAGLAGGADFILIPEVVIDMDKICGAIQKKAKNGKKFGVVVISEGAKLKGKTISKTGRFDSFGHPLLGGIGEEVAKIIREKTEIDTRAANLGHILRGGSPCAFDRILALRFGVRAVELVGKKEFGKAVVLRGDKVLAVPFSEIKGERPVNKEVYETAKIFFYIGT